MIALFLAFALFQTTVVGPSKIVGPTTLPGAAGGGASLISEVASQKTGQSQCSAPSNKAYPNNVTNGNAIIVSTIGLNGGAAAHDITPAKSSGTATINSFVEDKTFSFNDGTNFFVASWWRADVTGTGSLTLSFTPSAANSCNLETMDEFHRSSGTISVDGSGSTNSATSSTESTGNVVTSTGGLVVMTSSEVSTGNFTYTLSDTVIFSDSNGATDFTGEAQFKITNGSGTYNLTAGTGNSWFWGAVGFAYK